VRRTEPAPALLLPREEASAPELSILMPCLNESETLRACIDKARAFLLRSGVRGEIVIADNGSTDGSQEVARGAGARVAAIAQKGYGSALLGGIAACRGRFIIMGDADDSYDFERLDAFVGELRAGADLVMGNRFAGGIRPGAMPPLHRYVGNPILSGVGRLFFKTAARDLHCGLRGFVRTSILSIGLRSSGMEFASEMVVKASLYGLRVVEVPTSLDRDGRSRPPHLRSWHDGWRHLRFMLLYSPLWLFFVPGYLLTLLGCCGMILLLPGPVRIGGAAFDVNSLLYAGIAIVVGVQIMLFSIISKVFATCSGLLPQSVRVARLRAFLTLERGVCSSALLIVLGFAVSIIVLTHWQAASFGRLDESVTARLTVPAVTAVAVGFEGVFFSFLLSMIQIGRVK
jgi:glycosyltransferase involved in cell wall biosynthesis